ncbi:Dodecaprenyl-phosphate galacturonate synthase [bioreactor metagenome]|uniref:Dodecaprenyl-phosphate galacturonate synthase n=1 Tax=bioreactor metagenome TaxID=1076179 RepID=A0A645BJM9_9ZZZZ
MDIEISVVIPTYNEEGNVELCYREVVNVLEPIVVSYEIIFVDDGSTDLTFKKLQNLSKNDDKLKIIKLRKNFGQSAALKAGLDYATGKQIITMDSDLQNDPKDIPKLLEKLNKEDFDVVCGWRFDRKDTFSKKLFSKLANKLRKSFTGEIIHDSGCTLRAYIKESTEDLELYGELHRYIPAMLSWKGYRIGEIKTNHRERKYGKTKYDWKRIVKGFFDLLVVTFWQKYSMRPIHIFGSIGIILILFGGIVSIYLVILRLFYGTGIERPLFTVSIMSLVIGVQFFTIGILADILVKIYYSQKGRKNYLVERIIE